MHVFRLDLQAPTNIFISQHNVTQEIGQLFGIIHHGAQHAQAVIPVLNRLLVKLYDHEQHHHKTKLQMTQEINSQNGLWHAKIHDRFANSTRAELGKLVTVNLGELPDLKVIRHLLGDNLAVALPDSYTVFDDNLECKSVVLDQGNCGGCWAFATIGAFSDRTCIQSDGKFPDFLSVQRLISCNAQNGGCKGGQTAKAWEYIGNFGVFKEKCWKYDKSKNDETWPSCSEFQACEDPSESPPLLSYADS